jgi:hypothetical protein
LGASFFSSGFLGSYTFFVGGWEVVSFLSSFLT